VFGAEIQSAAKYLGEMRSAGIRHFRCEFVHQDEMTTQAVCESFLEYFADTISSQQLQRKVAHLSPAGTTDGSLYVPDHFKQLVQLF
jgi:putative protease